MKILEINDYDLSSKNCLFDIQIGEGEDFKQHISWTIEDTEQRYVIVFENILLNYPGINLFVKTVPDYIETIKEVNWIWEECKQDDIGMDYLDSLMKEGQ